MLEYIVGIFTGLFLFATIQEIHPESVIKIHRAAIEECEKTLPRTEHCKIVAIPVSKD